MEHDLENAERVCTHCGARETAINRLKLVTCEDAAEYARRRREILTDPLVHEYLIQKGEIER